MVTGSPNLPESDTSPDEADSNVPCLENDYLSEQTCKVAAPCTATDMDRSHDSRVAAVDELSFERLRDG